MINRIIAYSEGADDAATRDFYVHVLGLDVAMDHPALGLRSSDNPAAQVLVLPPGSTDPVPRWGIDLGTPEAVDAAHAESVRRGLRVVYPLTDESWGVRRFFVEDPGGNVVNVLAHVTGSSRTE
ncbi:VOC family protein [Amycolatopsis sp. Poz14]|uniref:VOC family protein n=1 Tax=Amycolatopsis sp. Poz14 TaxID=1447705 RepID=UPI001EE8FE9F|nr:VOC family protein [Amycolatopsis sp. Poz14]MCG3755683.1 VOC family protein [Amycolatopsis sp. Poz14]